MGVAPQGQVRNRDQRRFGQVARDVPVARARSRGCDRGASCGSREARTRCRSTSHRDRRGAPKAVRGRSGTRDARTPRTHVPEPGPRPRTGTRWRCSRRRGFVRRSRRSLEGRGRSDAVLPRATPRRAPAIRSRRSTRLISAKAASVSKWWNAFPTTTASALPSPSGIRSAVPATTVTLDRLVSRTERMLAAGSTAITRTPSGVNRRASWPVPAARSRTSEPGSHRPRSATQRTASSA